MREQNNPDDTIDSYWILVGSAQDSEANAHHMILKIFLTTGDYFHSDENLKDLFASSRYPNGKFLDGKREQEKTEQERVNSRFSNKLKDPNYSILEDITTDLTLRAKNVELMEVIGWEKEKSQEEIAKIELSNIAWAGRVQSDLGRQFSQSELDQMKW